MNIAKYTNGPVTLVAGTYHIFLQESVQEKKIWWTKNKKAKTAIGSMVIQAIKLVVLGIRHEDGIL